MELSQIQCSDSLEGIARVGTVLLKDLTNAPTTACLRKRTEDMESEIRHAIGTRSFTELESVKHTRKLYHGLGVDPTKDRPDSEKLLRRVVRGRTLPMVQQLVDSMNLVSLSLQCPIGVYDWDKVSPPVLVRIGRPEESYSAIGGQTFRVGGRIVLVDGEGIFGNPSHDAERTTVDLGTVRALIVAWFPADTSNRKIEGVLQEVIASAEEFCDAAVRAAGIAC